MDDGPWRVPSDTQIARSKTGIVHVAIDGDSRPICRRVRRESIQRSAYDGKLNGPLCAVCIERLRDRQDEW
jgi:hypothetical protein